MAGANGLQRHLLPLSGFSPIDTLHNNTPRSSLTPLGSLYRMYEYVVYDHVLGLRTEIEFFFNHSHWKVAKIPDPVDSDPKRYAIISVIPHLLVKAFNRLIERGLPRDAPAIIMGDEHFDELADRPRILETSGVRVFPNLTKPSLSQTKVVEFQTRMLLAQSSRKRTCLSRISMFCLFD